MGESISSVLSKEFQEVQALDFYRDLFPLGSLDQKNMFTKGMYCGIALEIINSDKVKRYSIYDDLETIKNLLNSKNFVIIPPLSYAGKSNTQKNARTLYALAFDLDGLRVNKRKQEGLKDLLHQTLKINLLPIPTYIVSSGNNIHLYYLLDEPLSLYDDTKVQLKQLRIGLINKLWNRYITDLHERPQYESFNQSFRAVGTSAKDNKTKVRAFKVGKKVSIEYLNDFVDDEYKLIDQRRKNKYTLDEAKAKFPAWYQRRIVEKLPAKTWRASKNLYNWWLRTIKQKGSVGHRYYCIVCLSIYAKKCGVEYEELKQDAFSLLEYFDSLSVSKNNRFTESDINDALKAYSDDYIKTTRKSIALMSGIEIPSRKRNYLPQNVHLQIARSTKAIKKEAGLITNDGRPSKRDEVIQAIKRYPDYSITQLAKMLDCSRPTIYKYLKEIKDSQEI